MEHLIWNIDPSSSTRLLENSLVRLMFASAFVFGYSMMQWMYNKEGKNVEDLDRMLWYLAIGIVWGQAGAYLFYDPAYYCHTRLKSWRSGKADSPATGTLVFL